VGIRKV